MLSTEKSKKAIVTTTRWQAAHTDAEFCAPGDHKLHLGLLPLPFCGDIRRATIYILLLNPGLGPSDYYGEHKVRQYRNAVLGNLKQQMPNGVLPFFFLDPQYSWHGGFTWWHSKLAGVIACLAKRLDITFAEARAQLARKLASIELVPYHSASFRDADHWIRDLHSVRLARAFIKDHVMPRVRRNEAIIVVTRRRNDWGIPEHPGVIKYTGGQARAAPLTPDSPGGMAMLDHLAR